MPNARVGWLASLPTRWKFALVPFALFVLLAALRGVHEVPDSASYVSGDSTRPPLIFYAWKLCGLLGARIQPHLFVLVQCVAGGLAAAILSKQIARLAGCKDQFDVLLALLLYFPQAQAATTLSSESFAYTFFSLFVACLAQSGVDGLRATRTVFALLFAGLCHQTRPQFIFLLPLAILLVAACAFWRREPRERATLAGGVAAVLLLLLGFQAAYHLPRSGRLGGVSQAGLQVVTVVGYLATDADVERLPSGPTHDFAVALRRRIVANGLGADTPRRLNASWQFGAAYNILIGQVFAAYNDTVAHKTVAGALDSPPEVTGQGLACVGDLYCPVAETRNPRVSLSHALSLSEAGDLDRLTLRTSFQLMRSLGLRYPLFIARMIYEHAQYWLLLTAVSLLVGVLALVSGGTTPDVRRAGGLLAGSALAWLVNACLVAAVETVQARYIFYTDSLLMVALVATLLRSMPFEIGLKFSRARPEPRKLGEV